MAEEMVSLSKGTRTYTTAKGIKGRRARGLVEFPQNGRRILRQTSKSSDANDSQTKYYHMREVMSPNARLNITFY